MTFSAPIETIFHLLKSRESGDIRGALSCYEADAIVVLEPGKFAHGQDAIRALTESTIALPIAFGKREIVEAEGIALHVSQWTLRPAGGAEISGRTADVLRRQPDGNWLLAIDNPWGSSLLDRKAEL